MTTLKTAIVPAKVSIDGTHKIRIAIGHKQETRYLVTRFSISNLSNFKDGQVVDTPDASIINVKLRNILNSYQEELDKINTDAFSCAQLREYLSKVHKYSSVTFQMLTENIMMDMKRDNRSSTADLYSRTVKYFLTYNSGDITFDIITPNTIKGFDRYLKHTLGLNSTTIGMHMKRIKAIINTAKRDKIIFYDTDPFSYYVIPDANVRELDITVEEFRMIRDYDTKEKGLMVGRDLFLLSYYLGGINLIDLMNIDFRKAKTVEYIREKTKNTKKGEKKITLTIPEEAQPIIKKWIGRNGKLDFGYKFSYNNFRNYVAKQIKKLSENLGIEKRVVYYSARKSLVQHGYEIGISLETLEYTIGQSMKKNRPIFNYLRIMRKHADEAMRKILDNLK